MKKIITTIFLNIAVFSYSQIILGGTNGTAPANNKAAVLLEFEAGLNKGFILPSVRTLPVAPNVTPGTMLLDASVSNSTQAKVRFYAPSNANADVSGWVDLSAGNVANLTTFMSLQPPSTGVGAVTEETAAKTIIGADTSTADGVLVLESTTKVMVLPHVATTNDIKDPTPGMMVYINGTNKRLAVYNGLKWTYWAAQ
ncbi:hypothetical protein OMO38_19690 [Chryseobacterium sp. 09-1422]|uniref:Uncharacterized protein n=1 Tax=Chryseobacterium kimseyorum TaxID=2984028 RepID=A0ABT3I3V7_9FLAO|nr:hypothetical protein [Chryseobacterium kimseyorum]MCW3170759.1 hypothetical protein [Chryseobacterium kimseyorum]